MGAFGCYKFSLPRDRRGRGNKNKQQPKLLAEADRYTMAKCEATERKRPRSAPALGRGIVVCATALLLVLLTVPSAHAFSSPASTSLRSTRLHMIGNVFGGGNDNKDPQLPKDVKDAISKCRGAVQKGLEDRISRMVCM